MSVVSLKKKFYQRPRSSRVVINGSLQQVLLFLGLLTKDVGGHSGKFKENHVNIKRHPTAFLLQVHYFFTVLSRTQPLALISVTHILFCKTRAKQTVKCKSTAKNTYQWPPTQTI